MATGFRQLRAQVVERYRVGDMAGALTLANRGNFDGIGQRTQLALMRACLLAQLGEPEAALDVLETGVAAGCWWSPALLADPDLDPCRGPRLDEVGRFAEGATAEVASIAAFGSGDGPVLMGLHGGGEPADIDDNPWAAAPDSGWSVLAAVSSQRCGSGLATWSDLDLAVRECREHIARIGGIDAIGAFSLGGSLALRLTTEVVPVPAVMIAPSLRSAVVEAALANARGARIRILTGEHDQFLEATLGWVETLRAAGAHVDVEVVPELGHEFPADLGGRCRGCSPSD